MRGIALVLLLAVFVVACGPSTDVGTTTSIDSSVGTTSAPPVSTTSPAPTTSTLPPGVLGEDWEVIDLDIDVRAAAVHDDKLFVLANTDEGPRLLSSEDGELWAEEADVAALSAGAVPVIESAGLASDGSDLYGYMQSGPDEGVSAEGASFDVYLLGSGGGEWEVLGPEVTGVDQRLEGTDRFRFFEWAGGIVAGDGQVHVAFAGQWWQPRDTSSYDFAAVSSLDGESWSTYAEDRFRVDPSVGWFTIAGLARSDDGTIVALSSKISDEPTLTKNDEAARISTDGVTWEIGRVPVDEGMSKLSIKRFVFGGGRFVAVGVQEPDGGTTTDEVLTSWVSTDGRSWEIGKLPTPTEVSHNGPELGTMAWTGEHFAVLGSDDQSRAWMWKSTDGINWERVAVIPGIINDSDGYPINRTRYLVGWNGGVVAFGPDDIAFSPPRG